jgi:DNA-directed RNA polymerase subunit RPC12/RpoP
MKSTKIDAEGTVRCPNCGSTSFTSQRSTKAKVGGGLMFGVGALAAPKRLRCNGCGAFLKPGGTTGSPQSGGYSVTGGGSFRAAVQAGADAAAAGASKQERRTAVRDAVHSNHAAYAAEQSAAGEVAPGARAMGNRFDQAIENRRAAKRTPEQIAELKAKSPWMFPSDPVDEAELDSTEPEAAEPMAEPEANNQSPLMQIRELAALHDQAVITDDEFAAKKAELLARI